MIEFMEASEYERMTGKSADLKPGQVLVFTRKEEPYKYDTIQFGDTISCEVKTYGKYTGRYGGNHECNV